jgi:hypothetical protein
MSNKRKLPKRLPVVDGLPVGSLMRVCRVCGTDDVWIGVDRQLHWSQHCMGCGSTWAVELCHEPDCEMAG